MAASATLKKLRAANAGLVIRDIGDPAFAKYGRVLPGLKPMRAATWAKAEVIIADAVAYEPSVAGLEADRPFLAAVRDSAFGGMPVQMGWCYGRNSQLDGLEYHKGIEVVAALTDVVLILGDLRDVRGSGKRPTYSSKLAEVFYAKAGSVFEFHCWCLHFAPIHVRAKAGFLTLVVLPKDTNTKMRRRAKPKAEEVMLMQRNKWLLVHPQAKGLVAEGACVGITSANIRVNPIA